MEQRHATRGLPDPHPGGTPEVGRIGPVTLAGVARSHPAELTAAGLAVSPDQQATIAAVGMAPAGAIGAFCTDPRA